MRPAFFKKDTTWKWDIRLSNASGAVDADSLPTVVVYKGGVATGESVTVTKPAATTGWYQCSFDPAGEAEHDVYGFAENVTISAVAQPPFHWHAVVVLAERGTDAGMLAASYTAPDNASITAIKAKTDNLPTDPADASDIASSFSTVNSTLSTIAGYLDTEVAAIKAKTDNLPSDPADQSAVEAAITSAVSTIRGADNDTLKTLSDQIDGIDSGGLTVDQAAALTRIDNKTALITGAKLSVAGAVTPGGDITIVIGDDRLVAADSELIRTITDTGGALFARLDDAASITFGAGRNGVADLITGTVTAAYASNVTTLTIEIDHADISADAIDSEDYTYQIQRITSGGDCVIEVSGNLTLLTRYVSRG